MTGRSLTTLLESLDSIDRLGHKDLAWSDFSSKFAKVTLLNVRPSLTLSRTVLDPSIIVQQCPTLV